MKRSKTSNPKPTAKAAPSEPQNIEKQSRTVRRGPGVRVVKHDPYAAHIELLPRISDKAIHDVVAYLASLR